MNYRDVINNIRDLGFSDDDEMQEFADSGLLYTSINRAITELNLGGFPIYETYEFDVTGADSGYLYITMPEVDENFLEFKDIPVLYSTTKPQNKDGTEIQKETQVYTKFNDYEIESEDTLVIDLDSINARIGFHGEPSTDEERTNREKYIQSFRIFYIADHEPFSAESDVTDDLPLPRKAHHLVPLLAAYYVWLEDEPAKAAQYYNVYEEKKQVIENRSAINSVRMKVLAGGI